MFVSDRILSEEQEEHSLSDYLLLLGSDIQPGAREDNVTTTTE